MADPHGSSRDGRLTTLIFFMFGILLFDFSPTSHKMLLNRNTINNTQEQLSFEFPNKLVLANFPNVDTVQKQISVPAKYTPFFFDLIPINSADKNMLMTVHGIGPALAEDIITYRQRIGPFLTEIDLQNLKGIASKRAAKLATAFTFTAVP